MTASPEPEPVVRPPSLADLDDQDRAILRAVATERAARGRGPTWAELRPVVGFPPRTPAPPGIWSQLKLRIPEVGMNAALLELWPEGRSDAYTARLRPRLERLRYAGWVEFTTSYRSLDVGPTLREAFRASRSREAAQ